MYDRVIVASGNRDLRQFWKHVGESLRDALALTGVEACRDADHLMQVQRQTDQSRDLIIVDRSLPGSDDPDAESGPLGAGFDVVDRLQRGSPAPACILVGDADNRVAMAAINWPLCVLLGNGAPQQSDMVGDLTELATRLAEKRDRIDGRAPPRTSPSATSDRRWALVDINLGGARGSYFSLRIGEGRRLTFDTMEFPFELDMTDLSKVVADSRALRKKISDHLHDASTWSNYLPTWRGEYEALGRSVYALINRDKFQYCWGRAWGAAEQDTRLRFILGEDAYDGLWESMFDPGEKWLMLKGTIARRTQVMADAHISPLDGGRGTVRMLAIASNVPDQSVAVGPDNAGWRKFWINYNTPWKDKFFRENRREPRLNELLPPLNELDQEMAQLKDLERETNRRHGDGELGKRLDIAVFKGEGKANGKSLAARVRDALTQGSRPNNGVSRFDVVHFAGHAIFSDGDGPRNRGYLVFGDEPETHMVPVSEFAGWLRDAGVQLVYLSCCRSSASRAAFEIAEAGIPLAIGFTWDLDSKLAVKVADEFYGALINNDLKVCKAFQNARRVLSVKHGEDDPIWASPVLVAQPTDWLSVERCLTAVA
jgi:hypothetical protein